MGIDSIHFVGHVTYTCKLSGLRFIILVGDMADGHLGEPRFDYFCRSGNLQVQVGRSPLLLLWSVTCPTATWVGIDLIVFAGHVTYMCKMDGPHFYYFGWLFDRRRVGWCLI